MKKILFIDRDGTLLKEPPDEQIDSLEKFDFLPGALTYLSKIAAELDFELVLVSNQDGLGTDSFPEEDFWPLQQLMLRILAAEGVYFRDVLIDRSFPEQQLATRKPGTAMLHAYVHGGCDMRHSFVIGDRASDVQLAHNLGCGSIRIAAEADVPADFTAVSWKEIYHFLKGLPRTAQLLRETSETRIELRLNLEGGPTHIHTGLGFFDHMLHQLARHGHFGLHLQVQGDLHVDEHHTIEDVALALGQAFDRALGSRKGIERYAFVLPMDDCLAQVALDLGGRPWLEWHAEFTRERIGDMPTEMFMHFFKSFCDTARCNLHISATGRNEHHKIESIFKAWARALRLAAGSSGKDGLPSTKGTL